MKRKLIEQVVGKPTLITTMSAGATTAHASSVIDRKGYLSAYVYAQMDGSAGSTSTVSFYVYESDATTGTFTIYDSANATTTLGISSSVTGSGFDVDLIGADRYIKVYAKSLTSANTIDETASVTVSVILGDRNAVDEPAT